MKSVQEMISHYQRSIERSDNDNGRLMHCIDKLGKLPISVKHLQDTGIGRTVNGLRKFDGEVGAAAKRLVQIWKDMVANEDGSSPDRHQQQPEAATDDSFAEPSIDDNHQMQPEKNAPISNSHSSSSSHRDGKSHAKSSSHRSSSSEKKHHHKESSVSGSKSNSERHSSKNHSSKEHRSKQSTSEHSSHNHRRSNGHASDQNDTAKFNNVVIEDDEEKIVDITLKHTSSDKEHRHKEHKSSSSSNHKSSDDKHKSSSGSSHHRSSKDHKDRHRTSSSKDNEKASKTDEIKKSGSIDPSGHPKEPHSKRKLIDLDIVNTKQHSSESLSANVSKKSKTSNKSKSEKIPSEDMIGDDGIDITSGKSFAEALGMMFEPPPSTSKSHTSTKSNHSSSASSSSSNRKSTISNSAATASQFLVAPPKKIEKLIKSSSSAPVLLSPAVKLKPLDDLSLDLPLPQIVTNYTPMPLNSTVMECVYGKSKQPPAKILPPTWTDETFGATLAARNMKTRVYSGVRTGQLFQVPPLMELCIRVLQKNIDAMEYTGGVPFEILKPVLERATPDQLFTFEHFNPYLMDDSDWLWEQHCGRKFRTKKREEMETWREMFIRCTEEQEERLNSLTMNIKRSQTESVPVRSTKMAFVDSMVKAPRGVRQKQNQFGTDRKLIATPAARVASLSNMGNNIAKIGDTRLKVLAGTRDTAQATSSRPRKAPLMQKLQKSLSSLKGRFKR